MKWYYTPVSLKDIVSKQIEITTISNTSVNIYTSAHLIKTYDIEEKTSIDDLSDIFSNVKVRRTFFPPNTFEPLLYDTYYLMVSNSEKAVSIKFVDKNYLTIDKYTYKIVNKPDLKQINDITITSGIKKDL
jgi:hypothetical protein